MISLLQRQSIVLGKCHIILLSVHQPDHFYLTNHMLPSRGTLPVQFDHPCKCVCSKFDPSVSKCETVRLPSPFSGTEKMHNAITGSVCRIKGWLFNMSTCLLAFSAEEYHEFHMQKCASPLLQLLPFHSLVYVNFTVTCESKMTLSYQSNMGKANKIKQHEFCRPMTIHINSEYIMLNPYELVCWPLDKRRTQHIAHTKDCVSSIQESVCYDHEETEVVYHVNEYLKNTVIIVQPAVVQHHFKRLHVDRFKQVVPSLKCQSSKSRTKSNLRKLHLRVKSTKRHSKPVNLTLKLKSNRGKKDEIMYKESKCVIRPLVKTGEAKHRNAIEETQSGSSSLEFSNRWSAFNVLKKHAQQHSLLALCLPTRAVTEDRFLTSVYRLSREQTHGSNQQYSNGSHPVSVRHQVRLQYAENRQTVVNAHHASDRSSVLPTRDIDRNSTELHLTRLPFDSTAITQLLHASGYSQIIQQIGNVPITLQPDTLIPTHFILGVAYFKMSMYQEAQEHFKKCESVAKEMNRDGDVMLCNAYLGDMEFASQLYSKAAHYYRTAITYHTSGNVAVMFKLTPPTLSAIHAKLASTYRNASMMVQAIQHYKTAICDAQSDRDRLSAHTSLGNLYQSMGDNTNALEEYKQSIELAEKLSDYVSLGWAHGNIGNAYLGLNKKDEAIHYLRKSLDLAVEYEQTPQAIGRTYNNLGTAYQSMNDLDKAEEYYDLALSQAIYGNDIPGQARVYGNIGNVHMLRKDYEQAIPHYSEVLRLSSDPSTVSTARHNRGCAYYEWATSLQPRTDNCKSNCQVGTPVPEYQCTFHGPDCDVDECLSNLSSRAKGLYHNGCEDLKEVVKHHEERFQYIKGSPNGLTLSVSLFESNSRTFHRLQDCLVNLHKFEEALVVAEQSRARTLGELLLKRKGQQLMKSLTSPLSFDEIVSILENMECPLLYFSYTGARLICWLFFPHLHDVSMNTFEIPLADDEFNGKSFDYLLRYSLTENLVERSFEMYQTIKYNSQSSLEVQALYSLVGKPILRILQKYISDVKPLKVATVCDSYTSLLPLTCLFDYHNEVFLGDQYYFNQIPSLLTEGVMNQFPGIKVDLSDDHQNFCILGDPNIPPFYHNGDLWALGRLPHARQEAEWVAHVLHTTPVLGDQATKSALLIRLMNAKVVHLATHGSASAGFLAFSSFAIHANERLAGRNQVHGSNVLLYPEEVEKLTFSPALVVLSSCDSGRGIVKADGIQGMARAFILAGAQSVLTTLWKVPDESASVFMQFFYQYLLEEMKGSLALQKAILSIRCFAKYSQYIHWSGYQLTGQDVRFLSKPSHSSSILKYRLGKPSVFPRLSLIKILEKALLNSPCLPTDVQV